jgi:hypothetical protein
MPRTKQMVADRLPQLKMIHGCAPEVGRDKG